MPIAWNEIRSRALAFSRDWGEETRETAEAHTFWDELFRVFGRTRRAVAIFEAPVRSLKDTFQFIDLFWPGVLIAEHKSKGQSLERAHAQAMQYISNLMSSGREHETPRYVLLSDFSKIVVHDLDGSSDEPLEIELRDLHEHVHDLAFIAGYTLERQDPEDPANIKAAELLAALHDVLKEGGYPEHDLERFMVRLLFCMFAEDTEIFETPGTFRAYIESDTVEDGSDLGLHLGKWFDVLNTPKAKRQKGLREELAELPYVNGQLFSDRLEFAEFTAEMRQQLLACCAFQWSRISPAIFGSLFQSIMEPKERRQVGAHYTSEQDILKLLDSLFLDKLRQTLDRARNSPRDLRKFHKQLADIKILDPACGCGNFLVIAYRELRKLELEVLLALYPKDRQRLLVVGDALLVDVSQMHGIEIKEWPVRIAEVALWLVDHQMNREVSVEFGQSVLRLPLTSSPRVVCANALRTDWSDVLAPPECAYVLGNPPFVGKKERSPDQRDDMERVWGKLKGSGNLDYVTCWYSVTTEYLRSSNATAAFVSTNSITQGEQAGVLWQDLFRRGVEITFGFRTFPWRSEARGKAHVHVVIVGFGLGEPREKRRIFDYDTRSQSTSVVAASSISPYLADGPSTAVTSRSSPIGSAPSMSYGSMMIDRHRGDGDDHGLVFSREHRDELLAKCPSMSPYIRPLIGGDEFLNGEERWCLWLVDATIQVVRECDLVRNRIDGVRRFRESSGRKQTREAARTPWLFGEVRQPATNYLLIPKVSSELREYIPIGFVEPSTIASGSALIVPGATLYEFGILHSSMHMAWVRQVCGRMTSRYQYSARLVYNNFPWPDGVAEPQRRQVEEAASEVLEVRSRHSATLGQMYSPSFTPPDLARAHSRLDRSVERCYRSQPFPDERRQFEFLFSEWTRKTSVIPQSKRRRRK